MRAIGTSHMLRIYQCSESRKNGLTSAIGDQGWQVVGIQKPFLYIGGPDTHTHTRTRTPSTEVFGSCHGLISLTSLPKADPTCSLPALKSSPLPPLRVLLASYPRCYLHLREVWGKTQQGSFSAFCEWNAEWIHGRDVSTKRYLLERCFKIQRSNLPAADASIS